MTDENHGRSVLPSNLPVVISATKELMVLISWVSLVTGGLYLFIYTAAHGIPFPVSLSTLPSLLLISATVAIGLSVILLGFVILPSLVLVDAENTDYGNLYRYSCPWSLCNLLMYARLTGWVLALPMLTLYLEGLFPGYHILSYYLAPVLVASLIKSGHTVSRLATPDKKSRTVAAIVWLNALSFIWVFLIIVAIITLVSKDPNSRHWSVWAFYLGFPVILLFLLLLNYYLVVPRQPFGRKDTGRPMLALGVALIVLPIIVQPWGNWLMSRTLYLLRLGGEYRASFYYDLKKETTVPSLLKDHAHPGQTKVLRILLSVGTTRYVLVADDRHSDDRVLSIDTKNFAAEDYWQPSNQGNVAASAK